MRSGEDYLRAARCGLYFHQQGTHTVMHSEAFARDLLVTRHHPFGFHLEPEGNRLRVYRLDHTAHYLAKLLAVIIHLRVALGFTYALLNNLASCLGGYSTKVIGSGFDHYHTTQHGFRVHLTRSF